MSDTMGILGRPTYFPLCIFYKKYAYNLFPPECNNFNGKLNIYLKLELLSFLFSIHFIYLFFQHLLFAFIMPYFYYFSIVSILFLSSILSCLFFQLQLRFASFLSSLAPMQALIFWFLVGISSIFIFSLFALV